MGIVLIVVIANVIGFPVVLWAGNKWLDEFVYKTGVGRLRSSRSFLGVLNKEKGLKYLTGD